jgi:2-keto-4-pentenoate hydratase
MAAMSHNEDAVTRAAQRLIDAGEQGRPCAPVRDLIGDTDVACAYQVQERVVGRRVEAGARRVGRKIGLTSAAVQQQLGVDQPDFGTLLDTMVVDERDVVPDGLLLQPRIEAEIAFLLGSDLAGSDPSVDEVRSAVRGACASLEIVDSRVAHWDIRITDTVADNASSGSFVLGQRELTLEDFNPADVSMQMTRDGDVVSQGTGSACLGDPLAALQWLARTAASLGQPLRAGEVVLSGALGPMVPVRPGETYEAHITGLGDVRASFAHTGGGRP